jgi:hypothetical protein
LNNQLNKQPLKNEEYVIGTSLINQMRGKYGDVMTIYDQTLIRLDTAALPEDGTYACVARFVEQTQPCFIIWARGNFQLWSRNEIARFFALSQEVEDDIS